MPGQVKVASALLGEMRTNYALQTVFLNLERDSP